MEYKHTQSVASDTWSVVHNLNSEVICDVSVVEGSDLVKILPSSIEKVSNNELTIRFTKNFTGSVRVKS